MNKGNWRLRVW